MSGLLSGHRGKVIRLAVVALVLALAAYELAKDWPKVRPALEHLSVTSLVLAFLAGLAAIGCAVPAWRELVAEVDHDHRLPLPAAARVFLLGQLGKYVPGSVWVVLAQTELGRKYGVPRRVTATAGLLAMGVSLGTALVTAGAFLPFGSDALRHGYWWLTLLALVVLACLTPPVLTPIVRLGLRLLKREPLEHTLTWRGMGTATLWSIAGWLLYGLHTFLLARALGGTGELLLPRSIGAFAVAWSIGFLVIFAPAGGGAREAALVAGFSGVLQTGPALALALVSRVLLTVADLVSSGAAVLVSRRSAGGLSAAPISTAETEPPPSSPDVPAGLVSGPR